METAILILEAEEAQAIAGGEVSTRKSGFRGTGSVRLQPEGEAYLEWAVHLPRAGDYQLSLRYARSGSPGQADLRINQANSGRTVNFPASSEENPWQTTRLNVELEAGDNLIRMTFPAASRDLLLDQGELVDGAASGEGRDLLKGGD